MPKYFPRLLTSARADRGIFVLMSILIASLLVDTSLSRITNLGINELSFARIKLPIFVIIAIVYVIGQYIILGWVHQQNAEFKTSQRRRFNLITATVTVVQYILTAMLVLIIFQILIWSYYSTIWLILATGISYSLAIVMMALLAMRFFSWFTSNRNSVVLSYGVASAMLGVNLFVALVFVTNLLLDRPTEIREFL